MKSKRKEEIRNRLTYAANAHTRGVLPQLGDLKAMEELLAALDEAEERLDLVDPEAIDAIEAAHKKEDEFIRGVQEREDERKEGI